MAHITGRLGVEHVAYPSVLANGSWGLRGLEGVLQVTKDLFGGVEEPVAKRQTPRLPPHPPRGGRGGPAGGGGGGGARQGGGGGVISSEITRPGSCNGSRDGGLTASHRNPRTEALRGPRGLLT